MAPKPRPGKPVTKAAAREAGKESQVRLRARKETEMRALYAKASMRTAGGHKVS